MPSSRGCRSSYDCIVKIKGVTTRPILFSQLMRSDGEGVMNPEELFANDRTPPPNRSACSICSVGYGLMAEAIAAAVLKYELKPLGRCGKKLVDELRQ